MSKTTSVVRLALLAAPLGIVVLSNERVAFAQSQSPMMAVNSDAVRYPDGSRLREQFDTPNQPLTVPNAAASQRASVAGMSAATAVQARLPDGFTLLQGQTVRIAPSSAPGARANMAPSGASAAGASSDEKFVTLHPLAYHGVPLSKGSDYLTIVGANNRLLVTRKRSVPDSVDGTTPTVTADAAVEAARQAGGATLAASSAQASKPTLEVYVDDQQAGRLAWAFTISGGTPAKPDVRKYWVAALGEPRILNWESEVYFTQHGVVSANVWPTSPYGSPPTANSPLEDLLVSRSTDNARAKTGEDGRYGYASGTANAQITATLQGPFAVIQNQAGAGLQVAKSGGVFDPIDLNFGASSETDLAQTSAFYWVSFVHEFAQAGIPAGALANLPVKVNINATCNAFWDGSSLNFFHAAPPGGCPNTAYSDVAMHEFGHGIDASNGGILDGGYSEGFGDSVAVLGTRQPCVGRDFFGPGTCLRPATDVVLWPPPPGDEVHDIGRRYAGFVWELVKQLEQDNSDDEAFRLATRLVLGASSANPANIPDAVRLSFVVDAPDGNPAHGSPHFRALAAAADSRHIPRPPDPVLAAGATSASATFPWAPAKVVTANSVILQATIHLDRPAAVHLIANSSAISPSPIAFETGFYNDPSPGVVWTSSYRNLQTGTNQWENFGSTAAVNLPAGDNTIYWKIWITGGKVTLSSGSLLVEGFEATGASLTASADQETTLASAVQTAAGQQAAAAAPAASQGGVDALGNPITVSAATP
jgi:hypothetical protein